LISSFLVAAIALVVLMGV
jgi:hypothetical protein